MVNLDHEKVYHEKHFKRVVSISIFIFEKFDLKKEKIIRLLIMMIFIHNEIIDRLLYMLMIFLLTNVFT